jgi:ankyrin repeat protein
MQHAVLHALADADNKECVTPLHCAALAGSLRCARLLIDSGADTSARDKAGR